MDEEVMQITEEATETWLVDSAASIHANGGARDLLQTRNGSHEPRVLRSFNGDTLTSTDTGSITVQGIQLDGVVRVPGGSTNVLSVAKITDLGDGMVVFFDKEKALVIEDSPDLQEALQEKKPVMVARRVGNLYPMPASTEHLSPLMDVDDKTWHLRALHVSKDRVRQTAKRGLANADAGIQDRDIKILTALATKLKKVKDCHNCYASKAKAPPINHGPSRVVPSQEPLQDVDADIKIYGFKTQKGFTGHLVLIDRKTRKGWLHPFKSKTDLPQFMRQWLATVQNQTDRKVKTFNCDLDSVLYQGEIHRLLAENGTTVIPVPRQTHAYNGIAERAIGVIDEMTRVGLDVGRMPQEFTPEGSVASMAVRNLLTTNGVVPNDEWDAACGYTNPKSHIRLEHLKVMWCDAFVPTASKSAPVSKHSDEKQSYVNFLPPAPRARPGIMFGYTPNGYLIYMRDTGAIVQAARDGVLFDESSFTRPIGHLVLNRGLIQAGADDHLHEEEPSSVQELPAPRPTVIVGEPAEIRGPPSPDVGENEELPSQPNALQDAWLADIAGSGELGESDQAAAPDSIGEPESFPETGDAADQPEPTAHAHNEQRRSLRTPTAPTRYGDWVYMTVQVPTGEALRSEHRDDFIRAMESEIETLHRQGAIELVEKPDNANVITARWVLAYKTDPSGAITKFKARWAPRGFQQIPGVDFNIQEVFAPVVDWTTLRLLTVIQQMLAFDTINIDVVSAFSNTELNDDVYVRQPKYFEDGTQSVVKLKKALNGIKQSGHKFNKELHHALVKAGFEQSKTAACVYFRNIGTANAIIVATYVDDCRLFSKNPRVDAEALCSQLPFETKISDDPVFLGVQFDTLPNGGIKMHQAAYVHQIIESTNFCGTQKTPLAEGLDLAPAEKVQPEIKEEFQSLLGKLNFVANRTRPDIIQATNYLGRFASKPSAEHLKHLVGVVRFLACNPEQGLVYPSVVQQNATLHPLNITVHSDANWARNRVDGKSTTGVAVFVNEQLVDFASRKQKVVALSTMEAEYIAACEAVKMEYPIATLCSELGLPTTTASKLMVDNNAAIALANNPSSGSSRTRHIDVRYHYIQQRIRDREIEVAYIPSDANAADGFTKALAVTKHRQFVELLKSARSA
jgi:hypothetical protein